MSGMTQSSKAESQPLVVLLAVGLTKELLNLSPKLKALSTKGFLSELHEALPAVTCTAQASLLTGATPEVHGVVGNGWFFKDTSEVRLWQQSNTLIQAEPLYETASKIAARLGKPFQCAKLFWQFNQGAQVTYSVTPKPYYGANGSKAFGITGTPENLTENLETKIGTFPFPSYWGPTAGIASTRWIAKCVAEVLRLHRPDLTLAYLPFLDYDLQRFGPSGCNTQALVQQLEDACVPVFEQAEKSGATIWIVSEYGIVDVDQPVLINRALRKEDLLQVRLGPFGEQLDTFNSKAFAVCDHQIAHIYVKKNCCEVNKVNEIVQAIPGVARTYCLHERADISLDHPRSGEIIAISKPNAWFAYPFWLDESLRPDYAPTIDIHRKPGYDPCEMFFDPKLLWPKGRAIRRLIQKKLGFRTLFDVIPTDPTLIKGSHGLAHANHRPILVGDGPSPGQLIRTQDVKDLILKRLFPEF